METAFDRASLEVFYQEGPDKVGRLTVKHLKEGVSEATIGQIKAALDKVVKDITGDVILVNRTRYSQVEGA
ncbi:hypothetical protein [Vaginisenegalia massiliensis]|uniref:hypothetical protein n=1 Tax=Vaginisenegalia massiliensis TaxID=2058294 RepID=UPI000F533070|nr:hypothetical protein [Vaginisenegalia massiliensis]